MGDERDPTSDEAMAYLRATYPDFLPATLREPEPPPTDVTVGVG
jgi:hypothetical protein